MTADTHLLFSMTKKSVAALAAALCVIAAAALWWFLPRPEKPEGLVLKPVAFSDLPGWQDDRQLEALGAFVRSCARLDRLADDRSLGGGLAGGRGSGGLAGDWRGVCRDARQLTDASDAAARGFFESKFQPFLALNQKSDTAEGLFTGYYEPLLNGDRRQSEMYPVPLLARPDDLVMVSLGAFRKDLGGRRIAGRVEGGRLVPYAAREDIESGALGTRSKVLAWVDNPVDAFFLQIQGSGRIRLADGGEMRVGYAAANGHPYTAIGRDLVRRGALTRENVSMQSIRAWLAANPAEARKVMNLNRSYVFFRELTGDGPIGAQGVALTAGRSLAVDRRFVALGMPVWLSALAPATEAGKPDQPLRRLLVAQDTGGAIRGPVRGDVFWGHGPAAERVAGHMKHRGRYYLLLPTAAAARLAAEKETDDAD